MEQPERAHALLSANPQLAYALFQALLVHQIVDPAILHVRKRYFFYLLPLLI